MGAEKLQAELEGMQQEAEGVAAGYLALQQAPLRQAQAALSVIVEHFKASGRVPARACTTDYPRLKDDIGVAYRGCERKKD